MPAPNATRPSKKSCHAVDEWDGADSTYAGSGGRATSIPTSCARIGTAGANVSEMRATVRIACGSALRRVVKAHALHIHAAACIALDWEAFCAATICAETSQRRVVRSRSFRRGFPAAIWQFDQYSPVIPVTRVLAASNAWVAAPWLGDFMNSCAIDRAMRKASPGLWCRPVPFVAPGCSELTAMPRPRNRCESSLAYRATALIRLVRDRFNHCVARVGGNELLQRSAAIPARAEECAQASSSQQVFCSSAGEGIDELCIPRRSKKCVRSDQRARADARHDGEIRSRARAREASHCAGDEGARGAAAREREDVEWFSWMQSPQSLGDGR